jgi:glyoxylase-like metal-dependent hydrolase (beta-lactamase superfamily II)
MSVNTDTLRIVQPYPGIYAYYDGRTGKRLYSEKPNWLDDGAYSLGSASYSIVDGAEALVYDTHMSLVHARAVRDHLESLGVTSIRVVLSHWHADHIAGNAVFQDCEIIALELTAQAMEKNRQRLETRDPPISPIIMPTTLFSKSKTLQIGAREVQLHHFDIHSADGNVLWLADEKLLFAGDTLEDTLTYVSEPQHIETHIRELKRMREWPINRILPNHGALDIIESGGYGPALIDANRHYLERISQPEGLAKAESQSLKNFIAQDIHADGIQYFEPYEVVHRENIAAVKAIMRLG